MKVIILTVKKNSDFKQTFMLEQLYPAECVKHRNKIHSGEVLIKHRPEERQEVGKWPRELHLAGWKCSP